MLAHIRAFAKSPIATVLLSVLLLSFVVFGIGNVFKGGVVGGDTVIHTDGRPDIGAARYKQMIEVYKKQVEQQSGQPISVQELASHGLDARIADEIAYVESFAALMNKDGVVPSDTLVAQQLKQIPRLFNPISGQFDKALYGTFLRENNLNDKQFTSDLRDGVAQGQFVSGMAAGMRAPMVYGALQAGYLMEQRDFEVFQVTPKVAGEPIKPTDAQLQQFMKDNAARLMKPELRIFSVVHVSARELAATVPAPDAEMKKTFDFEKDTLSQPEKRTLVQITVPDSARAAGVAAALAKGQDPASAAKASGGQVLNYADQPKSAIPDRAVADAAFAAKDGAVVGPVQGGLGIAVLKVLKVTPGHAVTLDEVRSKVEAEVKKAAAEQKAYDLSQKYGDAHGSGATMTTVAKTLGVPVLTLPPIAKTGADEQGRPLGLPPKVLASAYGLAAGAETDLQDLGQGEYWAVRAEKVIPPAMRTLEEVRPGLTREFVLRDIFGKMKAKAQALADQVTKGGSMEAAAASVGGKILTTNGVIRSGAGQTIPKDVLGRVFAAKPGEVFLAQDTPATIAVIKLKAVHPGGVVEMSHTAQAAIPSVSKQAFDDIGQAVRAEARARIKPTIDITKGRKALGVELDAKGNVVGATPPSP